MSDARVQPTLAPGQLRFDVEPGDLLRVHHGDDPSTAGQFLGVNADRLSLEVDGRLATIAAADNVEVGVTSGGLRDRVRIGLAAGAASASRRRADWPAPVTTRS